MKKLILVLLLSLFLVGCAVTNTPTKAYVIYINSYRTSEYWSGQTFYINGVQYIHPFGADRKRLEGSYIKVTSNLPFLSSLPELNGETLYDGSIGVRGPGPGTGYETYVLEAK